MLRQNIVVWDLETSSARPSDTEIIQLAALAINPRNLTIYEGSEFESLMRPDDPWCTETVQEDALRVNKKTREELDKAPDPEVVWHKFAEWCKQWNVGGRNDAFSTPIPAGHNISGFDLPIYERYCHRYGTTRKARNGEVQPAIFNNIYRYDTLHMMASWTENLPQPGKLSLDYLRKYFGMSQESIDGAHDALQDVRDTAAILIKLLGLQRRIAPRVQFENCFKQGE